MRESATTLAPEVTDAELAALTSILTTEKPAGTHLEIGTAAGGTLRALMTVYEPQARPLFVVVDPMTYFPNQRGTVERNLRSADIDPAEVEFRLGYSWPLFHKAEARNDRFSFIFIDGNHKARHVIRDLSWARLLDPGGILCLHDYSSAHPGVIWAVDHFLASQPTYEKISRVDSLMILRKVSAPAKPEINRFDLALGALASLRHNYTKSYRKRFG